MTPLSTDLAANRSELRNMAWRAICWELAKDLFIEPNGVRLSGVEAETIHTNLIITLP